MSTYIPYGVNAQLDELYAQLGELEERDFDARCMHLTHLVDKLTEEMRPLRRQIVEIEGWQVYPTYQT